MQLKDDGAIKGDENPKDHDNSILSLYQGLAKIYTETKDRSGSKADKILQKLNINSGEIKAKNGEMNHSPIAYTEHQMKRIEQGYICDYSSLFLLSYRNDNFVTLPLIHNINPKYEIDINELD